MPSKKRTLVDTDLNMQPQRNAKQQKAAEAVDVENQQPATAEQSDSGNHEKLHEDLDQKKPEEYICVDQPFWDFEEQREEALLEGDSDEPDEEELHEEYEKLVHPSKSPWSKPISERPDHKWIMMWDSWKMLVQHRLKSTYCCPDNFDMYVYNDFHSYGMVELVEKALRDFNDEYNKKERNVRHMWAIITMLGHWLHDPDLVVAWHADDGERVCELRAVVECGFLTALHAVDVAGKLTGDSELRDLGLVMSLYIKWAAGGDDFDIDDLDEEPPSLRDTVVSYAMKAKIDLVETGCHSMKYVMEDSEHVEPLKAALKAKVADRWKWKKTLSAYKKSYGLATARPVKGGPTFDITKWSRSQRAKYNFDKKDPLANISEDVLQKDCIQLG